MGAAAAAAPAGASEAEPAAAAFFAASIFAYIDCAPEKPPAAGACASSFACEPRRLGIVAGDYGPASYKVDAARLGQLVA